MDNEQLEKVAKDIKIHALRAAKDSTLTIREKAKLFRDIELWAQRLSERLLVVEDTQQITPDK